MSNHADIIIENGRVVTMNEQQPLAEAVAIAGNRILAAGSRADIAGLKAKHTRVFDAAGGTVMPGLIESHVHIFIGAAELDNLNVTGINGEAALSAAVRKFAAERPAEKLIFANSALYDIISPTAFPTRHDLDRVLPDRPFAMMCADHHTVFANTLALKLAGILGGAQVPAGSTITMGKDGKATGELVEPGAFKYVLAHTRTGGRDALGFTDGADPDPKPTAAERASDIAVLKRGLAHCAQYGITSLHNMDGNFYQLELLQEIDDAGDFSVRVQSPFHMKNFFELSKLQEAEEMRARFHSDRVYSGRVKLFMDGVLDSWTALTLEEYPDRPGCFGDPLFTAERFNEIAIDVDRRGLQLDVHAIADGAQRRTLDGYEAAMKANGKRDSRHRIEHVEIIDPADIPRFKTLGVIASMQPTHAPGAVFPPGPGVARFRKHQLRYAYPWTDMRAASLAMPFSSDWPVSPVDPMLSFYAAMAREPMAPGLPDHRQTLDQCIAGYTRDGAFTEFAEHTKGKLMPGMLADVCVMSRDLQRASVEDIRDARAVLTIADGQVTFAG